MKTRTIAAAATGIVLATSQPAVAQSSSPPVQTSPAAEDVVLVSIFGTGITLSVGVDDTGHLTSVELTDGAGGVPTDAVATEVSPHEVKFEIGDEATKIEVEAEGRTVETEVETRRLAEITGVHTWSGELFGPGNGVTEVSFSVTEAGGRPVLELLSLSGPGAGTETIEFESEDEDDEHEVELKIELTDGDGNQARIKIEVEVENEDGGVEAELKISARSDLFSTERAEGSVEDPSVNTPIDDDHDDDHDDDEDDDDEDDDDEDDDDQDDDEDDDDEDDDDDDDHDDD